MRDHVVVVGYGTKGRAAVDTLLGDGVEPEQIVVVDTDRGRLDAASARGLVTVTGARTRSVVLRIAGAGPHGLARSWSPSTGTTPRCWSPSPPASSPPASRSWPSVREAENVHLLRQSGADSGRGVRARPPAGCSGMATTTPSVVAIVEDLLTPDVGHGLAEREVTSPRSAARRGTCATSCSAWSGAGSCTGSTRPTSTPSSAATACCSSSASAARPRAEVAPGGSAAPGLEEHRRGEGGLGGALEGAAVGPGRVGGGLLLDGPSLARAAARAGPGARRRRRARGRPRRSSATRWP